VRREAGIFSSLGGETRRHFLTRAPPLDQPRVARSREHQSRQQQGREERLDARHGCVVFLCFAFCLCDGAKRERCDFFLPAGASSVAGVLHHLKQTPYPFFLSIPSNQS